MDIAELEKKKAKGAFLPSLSMNAGLGTGHLSGTDYAFGSQVWNSFNESVGLTISIPIFSNRQYKTAYNKAKYAITTSQLELLNTPKNNCCKPWRGSIWTLPRRRPNIPRLPNA